MTHWMYAGRRRAAYYRSKQDQRFRLQRVTERSGMRERTVWALYMGKIRIWDVHGLTNLRIVMDDAQDYIKAARLAG